MVKYPKKKKLHGILRILNNGCYLFKNQRENFKKKKLFFRKNFSKQKPFFLQGRMDIDPLGTGIIQSIEEYGGFFPIIKKMK